MTILRLRTMLPVLGLIALSRYAFPQVPDRPSIELWISNRISQQLNVRVTFGAIDKWESSVMTYEPEYEYAVTLTAFSLENCKLEATYSLARTMNWSQTAKASGRTNTFSESSNTTEKVSFNLADIQPSLIISVQWQPWNAPKRSEKSTYSCTSARGCSVSSIAFAATASQIQYQDSEGVKRSENHDLFPIGTDTEGMRIVKALHDEAVSCGAQDVNKTLY
jgi:hypothetical protein